jgi:hypothetical protein
VSTASDTGIFYAKDVARTCILTEVSNVDAVRECLSPLRPGLCQSLIGSTDSPHDSTGDCGYLNSGVEIQKLPQGAPSGVALDQGNFRLR